MGMLSEAVHGDYAESLHKILHEAAFDPKWSSCRSAIKGFARETILPLYKSALEDSYSVGKPSEILKEYE